jgi:hypothetical protein
MASSVFLPAVICAGLIAILSLSGFQSKSASLPGYWPPPRSPRAKNTCHGGLSQEVSSIHSILTRPAQSSSVTVIPTMMWRSGAVTAKDREHGPAMV